MKLLIGKCLFTKDFKMKKLREIDPCETILHETLLILCEINK